MVQQMEWTDADTAEVEKYEELLIQGKIEPVKLENGFEDLVKP